MRSLTRGLVAGLFLVVLSVNGCGKKDDDNNNNNNNNNNGGNPSTDRPVEFMENLVLHTDLRTKISNDYPGEYMNMCLQKVKQGEREFVRVIKGSSYCSNYLSTETPVAELQLIGYKLLSRTGVEVGHVYQYSNAKNVTEFCTGALKTNCQLQAVEHRSSDQSITKYLEGIKINEATLTR